MATLSEVINLGKVQIKTTEDYDTTAYETKEPRKITTGTRNLKLSFQDNNDDTYHVDVLPYISEDFLSYNTYGRMCALIDPNGNVGDLNEDGTIKNFRLNIDVYGINKYSSEFEPYKYQFYVPIPYNKNYSTDAPDGGDTWIGNVTLKYIMGYNSSLTYNSFAFNRPLPLNCENIDIILNIPVFDDLTKLTNYIKTGDPSESINPVDIEIKGKNTYYYDYRLNTIQKSNHAITETVGPYTAEFRLINEDDKVAFVRESENIYTLACSNTKVAVNGVGVPFSNIKIDVVKGKGEDHGSTYEYGDIYTNIQFVENLDDATNENMGFWDTDDSFNGQDSTMELTEITTATIFTRPYYVTAEEMNNIAKVIFTSDVDVQTALQQGLWVYSGNPIDCVVDVCLYPIDLSVFIDRTRPSRLKFGGFVYSGQLSDVSQVDYTMIVGTNKTFEMLNQRISPIYNDFRDLSNVKYSLFLPYHGLIDLDNSIVGRTLKVQCKFDVFTSQLKYYLFLDGAFFGSYECAIGKHISVIGSDWLSKSSKNIATVERIQSTGASIVSNAISLNATGVVNSVLDSLQAYRDYEQLPTTQMSGSSTSGLNIYDPMGLYLIIEQYETIKPTNLNSTYGIATYRIAILGSVKGYCEISDIRLQSRALNEEQDEIVELLKQGVVI